MKELTKKQRNNLIDKLERELNKTCQMLYELSVDSRVIKTMHPFILVRVLPKELKTEGGIWLAENSQSKPVYEGIVISVWQPWDEERVVTDDNGNDKAITITHRCHINVGERVAFPHYEGQPMHGYLDDKFYRLIRESSNQAQNPYQQVLGTISYKGDVLLQAELRRITAKLGSLTISGAAVSRGANLNEVAK